MRKRVFGSIFLTALVTLLLTASLLLAAVHSGLSGNARERLAGECGYIARIAERGDRAALEEIGQSYTDRITLVGADGAVLYDSNADAAAMENHADREEFAEALETGSGEGRRVSATLSEKTVYIALRLSDGTVLRAAASHYTVPTLLFGILQPLILTAALTAV